MFSFSTSRHLEDGSKQSQSGRVMGVLQRTISLKQFSFCRSIFKFTGSNHKDFGRGGRFYSTDPDVNKAVFEADEAMKSLPEERLQLVAVMERYQPVDL